MSRYSLFLLCALLVSVISVGCCGPRCGVSSCNDCDGIGYGEQVIPQRPFDRLRNGSLFCGSGCGEIYVDEWGSNPPECCDPCQGADWIGPNTSCHSACRSSCWQPGDLARRLGLGLLGGRNCTGDQSSADCGCGGGCSDGGCGDGGCSDGSFGGSIEYSSPIEHSVSSHATGSSCGCSSTASVTPVGRYATQTATRLAPPKRDLTTRYR